MQVNGHSIENFTVFGKPHPEPYRLMESLLLHQAKLIGLDLPKTDHKLPFGAVYAVGDNPASDIAGARAAGDLQIDFFRSQICAWSMPQMLLWLCECTCKIHVGACARCGRHQKLNHVMLLRCCRHIEMRCQTCPKLGACQVVTREHLCAVVAASYSHYQRLVRQCQAQLLCCVQGGRGRLSWSGLAYFDDLLDRMTLNILQTLLFRVFFRLSRLPSTEQDMQNGTVCDDIRVLHLHAMYKGYFSQWKGMTLTERDVMTSQNVR